MIGVAVFNAHARYRRRHKTVQSLVRRVLTAEKIRQAAVNVVFVTDRTMKQLNRTYLRHDRTTDVITFPLERGPGGVGGEIYVCADQARRQAEEYAVTVGEELDRLVVHGALHLAGYDDRTAAQRRRMKSLEDRFMEGAH
jgi:probable rRNA maturation factor